jgi:hypothetical protein
MEKMFPTKKSIIFIIIIINDNITKMYSYIIILQCYRRGFKIIFSISKASKLSIMQDWILVVSDLVLCHNMYD